MWRLKTTLKQTGILNLTPNGSLGGVWQSGAGPAADSTGVYFATGNGTFDADQGGGDYGDSILRLAAPAGGKLPVKDFFTPYNQDILNNTDADLGSGGVVLLPNQTGPKVVGGLWSMPAFWNNTLYIGGAGDNLHQFSFDPVAGKLWTPQAFADRSLIERRAGSAREVCRAHNCKRQGLRRHPQQAGGLRAAALAAISEERGPQSTTSGQGWGLA